jgi:4-diphosphocytidyl-2-C-methyl-D-erythritol kinase
VVRELAPAKVNLVLQVGPRRADGLHELCSIFASLDLCDELEFEEAERDEVVCSGVEGPNLVSAALAAFRERVPGLPPLRATVWKRIPVAAGLGGGSADALGAAIGADVPSQVEPRHALVTGAGEGVEPLELPEMTLVLVPAGEGLSTAAVYAEADRIPSTRPRLDPDALRRLAAAPLAALARGLENDLEAAALSLRPELATTLGALREAGALAARITGSGPTAFGVFESDAEAGEAAALLSDALVIPLRQIAP